MAAPAASWHSPLSCPARAAVFFRYLIEGFTLLFTGHLDYTVRGHVPNPHLPSLGAWYVLFVPVIGAPCSSGR